MRKYFSELTKLFQIEFSESDIKSHSTEDIHRIKMVSTISLIGIINLIFYGIINCFIDYSTFSVAIIFYFSSAIITFGIIILNKRKFYSLAKILVALIFPFCITVNATLLIGKDSNSQVYILLFTLIPLFIYGFKEKGYMFFFIGLNLILYSAIEFSPPLIEPKCDLPIGYNELFKSINVFLAFFGAFIAIIFFQKFSNQKELQLIKQADELKKSQEHRDLIYSIIAHDLRSPFNGLVGLTEILVSQFDELDKPNLKNYLLSINKSVANLNHLLINLLDWSKMQSGKLNINVVNFKLEQATNEVIYLLSDIIKGKDIKFVRDIDESITVSADLYMVSTVIRNLLANAIKFTHTGGVIELKAKPMGEFIEICITDTGIGIPKAKIDELFSLNSNYNVKGTNNEQGTGLGLKICTDFVIANGGRIWVESREGNGSCFYFTLRTMN